MKTKTALIFGITGQDGSYLASFLIKKKYKVSGIYRKKKFINLKKLNLLKKIDLKLVKKIEEKKINKILKKNYDEIYFLSGQSSVAKSFDKSVETYESQIQPVKIILDYITNQKNKKTKFLYSSSSEIFGNINNKKKINENSKKKPISPYGLAKLIGYEIVKSYREMYKIPVCSAILFNHESSLRQNNFIFKKILNNLQKIKRNNQHKLIVGNIEVKRDWGWAPEYMEACYKILASKKLTDYIIATEKTIKLKKAISLFFKNYGLDWKKHIIVNKKYYRSLEIKENYADTKKLRNNLKWKPKLSYLDIIKKLINKDIY
jgi:GDPmannose 4,6-dehydratase